MRVDKSKWIGVGIAIGSTIFGAGGASMVLRADVARHERDIKELQAETLCNEKVLIRIDERLSHIEKDISEIKDRVSQEEKAGRD